MRPDHWLYTIPLRLRSLFRRDKVELELDEELRYHLENKTQQFIAEGLLPEEARYAALRSMDGLDQRKEECRDARRVNLIQNFFQDLRYGLRQLRKCPAFTAVAVLTLALGIGANTAIFTIVNSVLLKPLPVAHPEQLVSLYTSDFNGPAHSKSSYPDYLDFRDRAEVFDGLIAFWRQSVALTSAAGGGEPVTAQAEIVTGNYFSVLGVKPVSGRTILPEDDSPADAHPAVVMSHGFWLRRFGGDPNLVGKQIVINKMSYTVIGIAPPKFTGLVRGVNCDLWLPMSMTPHVIKGDESLRNRGARHMSIMGRLQPGVSLAQAQSQFSAIAKQQHAAYPQSWSDSQDASRDITLVTENESRIPPQARGIAIRITGLVVMIIGLVLAIACANLAGMLLARASARHKEMAVRVALGATRLRLVRLLLTESLLLAGIGGVLGLLATWWTSSVVAGFLPPTGLDFSPDWLVFALTAAVSLLAGVALGLGPALHAANSDFASLKEDSGTPGFRRSRFRNALVIGQVAASVLLLIVSGLFLQSLRNLSAVHPGFNPENLLLVYVQLEDQNEAPGRAIYLQMLERVRRMPAIRSASIVNRPGLDFDGTRRSVHFEGYQPQRGESLEIGFNLAGPHYFATIETPLLRGRDFTERDTAGAPLVVIINETLARRYFPGEDALGKRLSFRGSAGPFLEIIAIARDGKYRSLNEDPQPFLSLPLLQNFEGTNRILVRTDGDPAPWVDSIRQEILASDPSVRILETLTMEDHIGTVLLPMRVGVLAAAMFGLLAMFLACLGLYGVVSYFAGLKTHEIGIRIALGARRHDILNLVLRKGTGIAAVGIVLGLVGSFTVVRLLSSFLFGVTAMDLMTYLGVGTLLGLVSILACYLPARRASRIDPSIALRYE